MKFIKGLFYDSWGLRFWVFVAIDVMAVVLFFVTLVMWGDEYSKRQCGNFQEVTGREVKYINYDACYVKNENGNFIRYDGKLKEK